MPLIATRGAASAQGFGEFAQSGPVNYIEDVFSTYLYSGTSAAQTITNGINLSGKGGLIWTKSRNLTNNNNLVNTIAGVGKSLASNNTAAQQTQADQVTAFNSNGYTLGDDAVQWEVNRTGYTYASWTFREQAKFFDIVTYTGNGAGNQDVAHNLGSEPGCIIVKKTSSTGNWVVYHRSSSGGENLRLNTTVSAAAFGSPDPLSINGPALFSVGAGPTADDNLNDSGQTYVAYLFAHNAGGFGLTGTDNVISCGSYTGNGSATGPVVTLGYEPQWVLIKNASSAQNWYLLDNMRGMPVGSADANLIPNTSNAESDSTVLSPTATGFQLDTAGSPNQSGNTFIYIAIRRGPMKVPTDGTKVFTPAVRTGTNTVGETVANANFPVDLIIGRNRASASAAFVDRLRGINYLRPDNADAEASATNYLSSLAAQSGWVSSTGGSGFWNTSPNSYIQWYFKRAPGFFDEVCYNGTGSALSVSHNLQAVPELMIVKRRNSATYGDWYVYTAFSGNAKYQALNSTIAATSAGIDVWSLTNPTSTIMSVGSDLSFSASTYVAYLFATCAGVSKVGSYTGNGTTQTINCGFGASGARFVLIKRTDSTGDWYVYDTARGMTVLTDPYLLMNSTAAEVATLGSVTTVSTGFALNSTILAAINVNAGTYIFLAIA